MENAIQVTSRTSDVERRSADTAPRRERETPQLVIRPLVDVLESAEGVRLVVDLPGVAACDADVRVEMPHLRIEASRALPEGGRVAYRAAFRLPDTVDAETLSADLRQGVLEIAMQKRAQARARRIEVRNA
jgi:HSP20 family molecular chaperone IbpA